MTRQTHASRLAGLRLPSIPYPFIRVSQSKFKRYLGAQWRRQLRAQATAPALALINRNLRRAGR